MRKKEQIEEKSVQSHGNILIRTSFEKILITAVDADGIAVCWTSTPSEPKEEVCAAAATVAQHVIEHGINTVDVVVKGHGKGREATILSLMESRLKVRCIKDKTPIPHNGCRPPRRRIQPV